jgi:UDP-glucose 4-epimerase
MNILITGAHGYIGGKLAASLRAGGHQVGAIVRRPPSFESAWTSGINVLQWDMTQEYRGEPATGYDLLVHAAGANDVDSVDPRKALLDTVLTTRNAIDFCRRSSIFRFVYLSTFQVFGTTEGLVTDDSPARCANDYGLTHWFAEEFLRTAARNGIVDHPVIARPTNVYGAPLDKRIDRWTLVPSCFCKAAFESHMISLRTSGRQYRNFVHLDAVVDAIAFLAENFDRAKGRAYIVGSSEVATIRDVVEMVMSAYERMFAARCDLRIESDEPRTASPLQVHANHLADLGYCPPFVPTVRAEIETIFNLLRC